ncbi:MAG: aminodeoxychorismate lyase [Steroidobacteraceae bacterium]
MTAGHVIFSSHDDLGVRVCFDRGLHYGDGLFETIVVRDGMARHLDAHMQRLRAGMARLRIGSVDWPGLAQTLVSCASREDRAVFKLIVTRGSDPARGYVMHEGLCPTVVLLRYDFPSGPALDPAGRVAVRLGQTIWPQDPGLDGIKHCNRLPQVLARAEWSDPGIFESLHANAAGDLVSGTMTNVFVILDGQLLTPAIACGCVAGIARAQVIDRARAANVALTETRIPLAAIKRCTEMFLTNVRIGAVGVGRIDGRALGPARAVDLFRDLVA